MPSTFALRLLSALFLIALALPACGDESQPSPPGCDPNPCSEAHRSQCSVDSQGLPRCGCDPGFVDRDGRCVAAPAEDPCDPNPCALMGGHRSVCEPRPGGFTCLCDEGYREHDGACEPAADPCDPNPCAADAAGRSLCERDEANGFVCLCPEGTVWRDVRCQSGAACEADPLTMEVTELAAATFFRGVDLSWTLTPDASISAIVVTSPVGDLWLTPDARSARVEPLPDGAHLRVDLHLQRADGCRSPGVGVEISLATPSHTANPSIGPYLTLLHGQRSDGTAQALDPSRAVVVNFEASETFAAKVYYRPLLAGSEAPWQVAYTTDDRRIQRAVLDGLSPDSAYQYQVLSAPETPSPVFVFRTADPNADRTRLLVLGDHQDEEAQQRWAEVAEEIAAHHLDDFDFILDIGDMPKDDERFDDQPYYWWRVFFEKGRPLLAAKVIFPAIGNHDTPADASLDPPLPQYAANARDSQSFRRFFGLSAAQSDPDYYAFRWGNGYVVVLNSEIPIFYAHYPELASGQVARQWQWLAQELDGAAAQASWVFVANHVPPFSPAGGKDEVQYVRPMTPYLEGKVDWHFSGHVHLYQRVRPIIAAASSFEYRKEYGRAPAQGLGYLVVPPAGQWPRYASLPAMELELAAYPQDQGDTAYETGFAIVETAGDTFQLRVYGMGDVDARNSSGYGDDGGKRLLDSLSYTRRPQARSSVFPMCYYRGTSNGWRRTAMTLVEDHTWEIVVLFTPGEGDASFKFFSDHGGEKWYGDDDGDGKAHSNEQRNIAVTGGPGSYRIRFHDQSRVYAVTKIDG